MVVKKRAISESAKQKRRTKILNTAWRLYNQTGGQLPTVASIAQKAGLSKGTVYLYFKTKEEIFLELYLQKVTEWFESGGEQFVSKKGGVTPEDMARFFTEYVIENPILMKMGSIVKGVLEENIVDETLVRMKLSSVRLHEASGELIAENFPGITKDKGTEIALWIISLINGLWQNVTHPPKMNNIIKEENIPVLETDFAKSVTQAVTALIRGSIITESK